MLMIDVVEHIDFHLLRVITGLDHKQSVIIKQSLHASGKLDDIVNIGIHVICCYNRCVSIFLDDRVSDSIGKIIVDGLEPVLVGKFGNMFTGFHAEHLHSALLKSLQHSTVVTAQVDNETGWGDSAKRNNVLRVFPVVFAQPYCGLCFINIIAITDIRVKHVGQVQVSTVSANSKDQGLFFIA